MYVYIYISEMEIWSSYIQFSEIIVIFDFKVKSILETTPLI